jgi:hypothetical protein
MISTFSLHQRVQWQDGARIWTGTVAATWNGGADAIVHTDTGAIMPVSAKQANVPADTLEVDVNLDQAMVLALQILSRRSPPGSVTEQMLMLAAAVVKLHLQQEAAP